MACSECLQTQQPSYYWMYKQPLCKCKAQDHLSACNKAADAEIILLAQDQCQVARGISTGRLRYTGTQRVFAKRRRLGF
jgi:hypothetical protein